MHDTKTTVFGLFAHEADRDLAVAKLKLAGFPKSAIACLMAKSGLSANDFVHRRETKAPEGTATGGVAGAALGGALGWLAGLGVLAIPGAEILIGAGPVFAALAGVGLGSAVGGLAGALVGLGIPEYEAKRFEGAMREGRTLLSVTCDAVHTAADAKAILTQCGADDVGAASEAGEDLAPPPRVPFHPVPPHVPA